MIVLGYDFCALMCCYGLLRGVVSCFVDQPARFLKCKMEAIEITGSLNQGMFQRNGIYSSLVYLNVITALFSIFESEAMICEFRFP